MTENELSKIILNLYIEVHKTLGGPGLLEAVYEEALVWELVQAGLEVRRQLSVPIIYKGHQLSTPLRLDLVINDLVIVECKSVATYNSIFEVQTLTYLLLTNRKLGLVINFGDRRVVDGFHRVVNGL